MRKLKLLFFVSSLIRSLKLLKFMRINFPLVRNSTLAENLWSRTYSDSYFFEQPPPPFKSP